MGIMPEEAIEILEEVKAFDDSIYAYNPAYSEAIDLAIEALKAQEPKTIVVDEKLKERHWFGIWFGRCPNCEQMLGKKDHEHFCGYCGQAVKWDGRKMFSI